MAVADCTRECRYCGNVFEVTRKDRVYCSKRCGVNEARGVKNPGVGSGGYPGSGKYNRARPSQCEINGCGNVAAAFGLCQAHRRRQRLYGDPLGKAQPNRIERPCGWCGEAMSLKPASDQKYCSRSCSSKGTQSAAGKSVGGLTCYCRGCFSEFRIPKAAWSSGAYCSRACSDSRRVRTRSEVDALLRIKRAWSDPPNPLVVAEVAVLRRIGDRGRKARARIAKLFRRCADCNISFMQRTIWGAPEVCCDACKRVRREAFRRSESGMAAKRAAKSRRRARMRGLENDAIDPIKVFERDGWRCHLCKHKTLKSKRGTIHPRAPELDHIVSLADNGTHTWGNVACSCRACNGAKGARSMGQLGLGIAA